MHGPPSDRPQSDRILVVSGEAGPRAALRDVLAANGYDVLQADGAVEAIELLRRERVGLIVSDTRMPKGSARDLLNWLNRAQAKGERTPVVLTSDQCEVIEYLTCQLGVSMFLTQPIEASVLLKAVAQALTAPLKKAN